MGFLEPRLSSEVLDSRRSTDRERDDMVLNARFSEKSSPQPRNRNAIKRAVYFQRSCA
jgi:hypothetical protein